VRCFRTHLEKKKPHDNSGGNEVQSVFVEEKANSNDRAVHQNALEMTPLIGTGSTIGGDTKLGSSVAASSYW